MSALYSVTNEEISRLCGYLTEDHKIAWYLGIDAKQVRKVRSRMPKGERCRNIDHKCGRDTEGLTKEREMREHNRAATDRLKVCLDRFFRCWEIENGFVAGAGMILLPAGYAA